MPGPGIRAAVLLLMLSAASCSSCSRTPEVQPPPPSVPKVRVLLLENADTVDIAVPGRYEILVRSGPAKPRRVASGAELRSTTVRCSESDVIVDDIVRTPGTVAFVPDRVPLEVGGRRYRGTIEVTARAGKLRVINIVDLEGYLRGVIPAEMYRTWPHAALQAQAIAARSYARIRCAARKALDFDLYATVSDQKYDGLDAESARTDEAVSSTAGLVLLYRGQPFIPYYHSTCSGFTADARLVFANPSLPPPLHGGRRCGYCDNAPRANWSLRVTLRQAAEKLGMPNLYGVSLDAVGLDGRVGQVILHRNDGAKQSVPGTFFRQRLGLFSTRFIVRADGPDFVFEGHGYGHGAGMCQYGAKGMAEAGKNYKDILYLYYPGAALSKVY